MGEQINLTRKNDADIISYVGNKMVTYVLQALGCDVSAIDTVHFSMSSRK